MLVGLRTHVTTRVTSGVLNVAHLFDRPCCQASHNAAWRKSSLWPFLFLSCKPQPTHPRIKCVTAPRFYRFPPGQSIPPQKGKQHFPVVTAINRKQLIKIYEGGSSAGQMDCPLIGGWGVANRCQGINTLQLSDICSRGDTHIPTVHPIMSCFKRMARLNFFFTAFFIPSFSCFGFNQSKGARGSQMKRHLEERTGQRKACQKRTFPRSLS